MLGEGLLYLVTQTTFVSHISTLVVYRMQRLLPHTSYLYVEKCVGVKSSE